MLEYNDPTIRIIINLGPGIYPLVPESSTGKTRLYKHLEMLSASGFDVAAYNYTSYRTGAKITPEFPELLMVDRLDMFYSSEFMLSLSRLTGAVVLLDIKDLPTRCPVRVQPHVTLTMRENEIEVGYVSI